MKITMGTGVVLVDFSSQASEATVANPALISAPAVPNPTTTWSGTYRVETIGQSDAAILARISAIEAHHAAKSDRLNAYAATATTPLVVGAQTVEWGVSLVERGTDVELVVCAADAVTHAPVLPVPLTRIYPNVNATPDPATVAGMLVAAITEVQQAVADKVAQVARLKAQLGLQ